MVRETFSSHFDIDNLLTEFGLKFYHQCSVLHVDMKLGTDTALLKKTIV